MIDSPSDPSRRRLLLSGTATLGVASLSSLPLTALAQAKAPDDFPGNSPAGRKVLHVIGHSHIDAAWLWPWRDGADAVFNTFRSALDRMQETPKFRYSHSSAAHYRWVERSDPAMFAEIRSRIQEGRWEVVGGWPVEPDCNIPSTESFVRHCLYGKAYMRSALGVDVEIGFNPDSFGHAAGLPTILKHAGYRYYVFSRPGDGENTLPRLFWWEGPDGSRVLAHRLWPGYNGRASGVPRVSAGGFAPGFADTTFFLGVGDHGGGVTKDQILQMLKLQSDSTLPELRWSTLRDFFAAVERSPAMAQLPVVRGELQHHARGCYSAYGEGKFQNRRAERSLSQAETISVTAAVALGIEYPHAAYANGWWDTIFCQFHDLLAGTAQYADYQDVRDELGMACALAQASKIEALQTMARRVDTHSVAEGAVFLFNPLPWARKALIEFIADDNPSGQMPITHLLTHSGQSIPLQWRAPEHMTHFLKRLSAWVELPPCGYRVLELAHGAEQERQAYKDVVKVSELGYGISSFKAPDGTQLLSGVLGLVVISDTSDTWAHGVDRFRKEIGRPQLVSSKVIENGPVTRVTRQRARWGNSEIVLDIAEFAGLDFVELRFVIDWHEREQILKLELPVAMQSPRLHAKVAGAAIERATHGEEEPCQDWVAVTGKLGHEEYTLALLNNSTYSYDCLEGLLRTVLIRSAPFARHLPDDVPRDDINAWQDQGRQERRFWLMGGKGSAFDLHLDRVAQELQTPAEYVSTSAHPGSEPWERSFMEVQPGSVEVLALKRTESTDAGIIVRLQERAGVATEAHLSSEPLRLSHTAAFKPWQIKTLLVTPAPDGRAKVIEVNALES